MRAVVQRVSEASVTVDGRVNGRIERGYVILLGITHSDTPADADFLAAKCAGLRVMEDDAGKMNLSLADVGGKVLVISQFTLYGDAQRGNRPSFTEAAIPAVAIPLYERFLQRMEDHLGTGNVMSGVFGTMMDVRLCNDGPVTILLHSKGEER